VRQASLAAALGLMLLCGVCARAIPLPGARESGATLSRLLLLYVGTYLAGYLFFGSQLRPHYAMPLFPVPALALGLLAGSGPGRGTASEVHSLLPLARQALAIALALALAGSNVAHTWQAGFLPDHYQITLLPDRSNQITLAQMRQVSAYIIGQADNQRFNVLFTAPDDTVDAYAALLLAAGGHLSGHPALLRFVMVQPPAWPAARWPGWVRRLTTCAGVAPARFAAALVWTVRGPVACPGAQPAFADNPPLGVHRSVQKRGAL
jgi:hypothetical protein